MGIPEISEETLMCRSIWIGDDRQFVVYDAYRADGTRGQNEKRQLVVSGTFRLYVYKDKSITTSLLTRAQDSGCKAIVLTVDTPVLGNRLADARNGFSLPDGLT
ncbi:hypothetical protein ANCDUO_25065 [Ancylostoma duodenale]|uniref:FMN hydroxy acid dehydrogenase domain-containing protein n=1 Tax=Ancylostoma duodenale TaxID=51022 RepID=A0A0C2C5F2_9BILA|nr:hypothetical protein ANCDUO_25065 [Ancylostoma duodenale]